MVWIAGPHRKLLELAEVRVRHKDELYSCSMHNGRKEQSQKAWGKTARVREGDNFKCSCFRTHCDLLSVAGFCFFCLPFARDEIAVSKDQDSLNLD